MDVVPDLLSPEEAVLPKDQVGVWFAIAIVQLRDEAVMGEAQRMEKEGRRGLNAGCACCTFCLAFNGRGGTRQVSRRPKLPELLPARERSATIAETGTPQGQKIQDSNSWLRKRRRLGRENATRGRRPITGYSRMQ